ncbi:hypothetical protein ELI_06500 [Erythrobacter litoralis HTCC2594]|uniref:Uncharacterized protein n=1 Tax=Erythrobacter litoralis (strain HTCC2594) TaxID=314225 RepID=Q2NA99_ERYLH|nr:hypothetical protein ELI_06500 [Erythrobacter litoralis HTCC2594]
MLLHSMGLRLTRQHAWLFVLSWTTLTQLKTAHRLQKLLDCYTMPSIIAQRFRGFSGPHQRLVQLRDTEGKSFVNSTKLTMRRL